MSRRCDDCCGDCVCKDNCDYCPDTNAPANWSVQIGGLANSVCLFCTQANGTYTLDHNATNSCIWSCTLAEGCAGSCDLDELTLTLSKSGSDFLLTVQMGEHVWELNNGTTEIACCTREWIDVPHKTNSGDCDSSSATCRVQCGETACPPLNHCTCPDSDYSRAPCCFSVTLSGIADGDCVDPCTQFNREHFLKQIATNSCTWECDFGQSACSISGLTLTLVDNLIKVTLGPDTWQLRLLDRGGGPDLCHILPVELRLQNKVDTNCVTSSSRCVVDLGSTLIGGTRSSSCPCHNVLATCRCGLNPPTAIVVDLGLGDIGISGEFTCDEGGTDGRPAPAVSSNGTCGWFFFSGGPAIDAFTVRALDGSVVGVGPLNKWNVIVTSGIPQRAVEYLSDTYVPTFSGECDDKLPVTLFKFRESFGLNFPDQITARIG